jgi:hypothetical protein
VHGPGFAGRSFTGSLLELMLADPDLQVFQYAAHRLPDIQSPKLPPSQIQSLVASLPHGSVAVVAHAGTPDTCVASQRQRIALPTTYMYYYVVGN